MKIKHCQERNNSNDKRLHHSWEKIRKLIDELNKKEIPDAIVTKINTNIDAINSFEDSEKRLQKKINQNYAKILKLITKELEIVPLNFYQNQWIAIGMAAFGLPLGVVLFSITQNPVFIAIGLPLGLPVGLAIGRQKDIKAANENKQIQVEE